MKVRKGQTIKFTYISDLTGVPLILTGTVLGFGKEVRQKWPIEMENAPDDMLLVKRQDVYGNTLYHAVALSEIIQNEVVILKKEAKCQ